MFKLKSQLKAESVYFAALLVLFAEYGVMFILKTSFVIDGVRYFSLFDDAMISMRYARNLAQGFGLVWNPGGEHVEGYTNFLWTLVMSPAHLLTIPPEKVSLVIQVLSLALLAMNLVVVRRIALHVSNGSTLVSLGSVFLTAFYFPLNNWSLQGMEVGLLTTLTSVLVWHVLCHMDKSALPRSSLAVIAIAILTRTDMALLCLTLLTFHAIVVRTRSEKIDWSGFIVLAVVIAAHSVFRYLYYGNALPNTYYLKVMGYPLLGRLSRGASALWEFSGEGGRLIFLLPFLLLLMLPGKTKQILLLLTALAVQCAYSIYVGGDAWEWYGGSNRYISVVMPLMFILLAWCVNTLVENVQFGSDLSLLQKRLRVKSIIVIFLIGFVFVHLNEEHWDALTLIAAPLEVRNNEAVVRQALLIRETTTADATIAVVWAGAIPYFAERTSIDILGKNDAYIARSFPHMKETNTPGHGKWDYAHSIIQPLPDVVVQLWLKPEEVVPFLKQQYMEVAFRKTTMYFKKSSPHIRYDALPGSLNPSKEG